MVYTEFTKAFFSFVMTPVVTALQFLKKERAVFCVDFREASKYTTTLCAHVIYRIKPKSEDKRGIYAYKFIYYLKNCMNFTAQIFIKISITKQSFCKGILFRILYKSYEKYKRKR